MLIEILKRTPFWVFILFFALIVLGYSQCKDRTVRRRRISILPVAMIALSFCSVLSAFGMAPVGLTLWGLGVTISVGLGVRLVAPRGVTFSTETQSFFVPGSWLPLAFMMLIFFAKYAVGIILARQLPVASKIAFVSSVSFCYGLFSGVFLARAIVIWQAAKPHAQTDA